MIAQEWEHDTAYLGCIPLTSKLRKHVGAQVTSSPNLFQVVCNQDCHRADGPTFASCHVEHIPRNLMVLGPKGMANAPDITAGAAQSQRNRRRRRPAVGRSAWFARSKSARGYRFTAALARKVVGRPSVVAHSATNNPTAPRTSSKVARLSASFGEVGLPWPWCGVAWPRLDERMPCSHPCERRHKHAPACVPPYLPTMTPTSIETATFLRLDIRSDA